MEEAPENCKESSYSAHANGMNEWTIRKSHELTTFRIQSCPLLYAWIMGVRKNSTTGGGSCILSQKTATVMWHRILDHIFPGPNYLSNCHILKKLSTLHYNIWNNFHLRNIFLFIDGFTLSLNTLHGCWMGN